MFDNIPTDSKYHGAYMGPTLGRQDPGGPHFGPMNLAIRASIDLGDKPLSESMLSRFTNAYMRR